MNLDAATLAGLAENPGEPAFDGPIPAEMARELAAAARRWRAAQPTRTRLSSSDQSVADRLRAGCSTSRCGPRPERRSPRLPRLCAPLCDLEGTVSERLRLSMLAARVGVARTLSPSRCGERLRRLGVGC